MHNTSFTTLCRSIFERAIKEYHISDDVNSPLPNPCRAGSIDHILYLKSGIDLFQWHLEDLIRKPSINPVEALAIKRRIDRSNQERTDTVELIDDYFHILFGKVMPDSDATINTESPAWAIDRLSILIIKIYHMREEILRPDATPEHRESCEGKLKILLEQQADLCIAIDRLLDDISNGKKYMKAYRQMKMYNDPSLNPVLYNG